MCPLQAGWASAAHAPQTLAEESVRPTVLTSACSCRAQGAPRRWACGGSRRMLLWPCVPVPHPLVLLGTPRPGREACHCAFHHHWPCLTHHWVHVPWTLWRSSSFSLFFFSFLLSGLCPHAVLVFFFILLCIFPFASSKFPRCFPNAPELYYFYNEEN